MVIDTKLSRLSDMISDGMCSLTREGSGEEDSFVPFGFKHFYISNCKPS